MFIGKQVGVEPWRFLFFSEALPCFLVGVLVLLLLPDEPASCGSFLDADGHRWLCERSARMQEEKRKLWMTTGGRRGRRNTNTAIS